MWRCRSRRENSLKRKVMIRKYFCFSIAILSVSHAVLSFSQCRPISKDQAKLNSIAERWTRLEPHPEGWSNGTDTSFWTQVTPEKRGAAEAKLASVKSVPLNDTDAAELTARFKPDRKWLRPYLVRAVAPIYGGKMFVRTRSGTQVWVDSGVLSHCDVPIEKRPLVIWLKSAPKAVFISFSEAQ
jgi:hypothetical protein